jgi:hypothetical protein
MMISLPQTTICNLEAISKPTACRPSVAKNLGFEILPCLSALNDNPQGFETVSRKPIEWPTLMPEKAVYFLLIFIAIPPFTLNYKGL